MLLLIGLIFMGLGTYFLVKPSRSFIGNFGLGLLGTPFLLLGLLFVYSGVE